MPHRTSSTRYDYERKINYDWPYQPKTPIRGKLNQVQEESVPQEVKEMLKKGAVREAIH